MTHMYTTDTTRMTATSSFGSPPTVKPDGGQFNDVMVMPRTPGSARMNGLPDSEQLLTAAYAADLLQAMNRFGSENQLPIKDPAKDFPTVTVEVGHYIDVDAPPRMKTNASGQVVSVSEPEGKLKIDLQVSAPSWKKDMIDKAIDQWRSDSYLCGILDRDALVTVSAT
ncbi:hypothetical protein DFR70_12833 [Nocardia tenerifensis]|uniref:Uncharacterized protein n=1 Tax=Nocardia tenerifensis TaxID=228006 RepID=A0A318JSD4_9NOCA|nr:hypothetical protein [Nocardia tenerifensis]PXX53320.1 hypothetical protein DFR70_12833 [Nocardia tenerifensis]